MHSGEHVFVQSLMRQNPSVKVEKVETGDKESKVYVFAENLDWKTIFKAEELANKIIKEGRDIVITDVDKKEAVDMGDLRVRLDRIEGDKVRVVEVKDFDKSACAGEHCSNTSEIKGFLVTNFNSLGNKRYEIRFMVDIGDELFEQSEKLRKIMSLLNTEKENVIESLIKLKEKNKSLKEQLRELQKDQALKVHEEKISSVNLIYGIFEDYEKLILMRKSHEFLKKKTIVCFLNNRKKGTYIVVNVSEDSGYNANELLQNILKEFNGKGGGKANFASGFVDNEYKDKVISKLKESLK